MSRVTTTRLLDLGNSLNQRERLLIRDVAKLRLATHAQLAILLGSADAVATPSAARATRRVLAKLTDDGILARLNRRVGGIRAGSAGYCYYLGPVGQRLLSYWDGRGLTRGRFRPEPGGRYVRHRLAVSELYVQTRAAEQRGQVDVLAFDIEPDCWRTYLDGFGGQTVLKPDAFVRLGLGAYVDSYFVEVDLGTESRPVIARKLRAYLEYFHSGTEQSARGVFPRVVLLTTTEARRDALVEVCTALPAEHWDLFSVALLDGGLEAMTTAVADDSRRDDTESAW